MIDFLKYIQGEINEILDEMEHEIETQEEVEIYDRLAMLTQEISLEIEGGY